MANNNKKKDTTSKYDFRCVNINYISCILFEFKTSKKSERGKNINLLRTITFKKFWSTFRKKKFVFDMKFISEII